MNITKQLYHKQASKVEQFQSEVDAPMRDNEVLKHYLANSRKRAEDELLVQMSSLGKCQVNNFRSGIMGVEIRSTGYKTRIIFC